MMHHIINTWGGGPESLRPPQTTDAACDKQGRDSRLRFRNKLCSWNGSPPQADPPPQSCITGNMLSLTGEQAAGSAAFPTPRGEVDIWGCCISATTGRLSAGRRTSPTSAPTGPAAPGRLPPRTAHTHSTEITLLLGSDLICTHTHTHTYLNMVTPVLVCHAFLDTNENH